MALLNCHFPLVKYGKKTVRLMRGLNLFVFKQNFLPVASHCCVSGSLQLIRKRSLSWKFLTIN